MTKLNRRQALTLFGAAGAAAPYAGKAAAQSTGVLFRHGVASGDPDYSSIVLWTRVTTDRDSMPVRWELAEDEAFTDILLSGEAEAVSDADHTVKVIAGPLAAGQTVYYRFIADGETSMTGRTRTLPEGHVERLGVALVSCSNYAFGFFNAYQEIASDPAIDFVLHTGDYLYEYGADEWGGETASAIGRVHAPAHEIVSLSDYRTRHAQYKSDAGSQAMLAAHPLLALWDDHESANNPWTGGAQNHQPDTEGDWAARREASIRAYYEWMPIREPAPGMERAQFWRTYVFGDLATLVTMESRHTGRGRQVDYKDYVEELTSPEAVGTFLAEVIGDPSRRMLSAEMEATLRAALEQSVAAGQPWRILGNAIPMARMPVPDVTAYGVVPEPDANGEIPLAKQALIWKGQLGLPFYTDTWDGYAAARENFYALCREAGATDLLVLTGDSHSFWANRLHDGQGRPMGLELGTAGVSSPGDFVESGWDESTAARLDEIFAEAVEEVVWTDNLHQGYVRVELTPEAGTATYVAVDTVLTPDYRPLTLREMPIARKDGGIDYAS